MRKITFVISLLLVLIPVGATAGLPMETVQNGVSKVLEAASDPALKSEAGKQVKITKIKAITGEFFDYTVLARLTLGRNWQKLSPTQQNEFIALYRALLEKVYMDRILSYSDEKVEYVKEISLSENKSEVQTRVITATTAIPIDYRLYNRDGLWKVYDVIIEGVSMVKNYRTQFDDILNQKTPQDLIQIMRDKTGGA